MYDVWRTESKKNFWSWSIYDRGQESVDRTQFFVELLGSVMPSPYCLHTCRCRPRKKETEKTIRCYLVDPKCPERLLLLPSSGRGGSGGAILIDINNDNWTGEDTWIWPDLTPDKPAVTHTTSHQIYSVRGPVESSQHSVPTKNRIIFLLIIMRHWRFLVTVLTALWPSYNSETKIIIKIFVKTSRQVLMVQFYSQARRWLGVW